MKSPQHLLVLLAILLLTGLCLSPAWGQEERLVLTPPLSQVFPLDPKPEGMRLKYPVLLNSRTVLGPEVVLRFIYNDPNAALHPRGGGGGGSNPGGGGGGGGHGHHRGGGGGAQDGGDGAGGSPRGSADDGSAPEGSGSSKDASSEIRTEVWNQASLFREALDEAAGMGTTLVYTAPGKTKPQSIAIDLPDGMFLAQIGAHITVLAMTGDSRAFESGVHPQDEIRSVGGSPGFHSLTDFAQDYLRVQEQAKKDGTGYSVQVWRPSDSRLVTIQVAAPPSLRPPF